MAGILGLAELIDLMTPNGNLGRNTFLYHEA